MAINRKLIFLCLFFISGACGLIYEIVWSRLLVFVFGGTTFAITTVLTCFMGGLALGSYIAGRFSVSISRPLRIYGILEICIGIFCLFVPLLFDFAVPIYRMLVKSVGESLGLLTTVRMMVSIIILIIPTTCMGATLPVLSRGFIHRDGEIGSNVACLYGFNTIGAFLGCVGAGFFLLPTLGLKSSICFAVILNITVGIIAIILTNKPEKFSHKFSSMQKKEVRKTQIKSARQLNGTLLLVLYGLSGFSAMAFQVAWTRSLILSLGSSTYAFSIIVACFIFGLAIGSFLISVLADKIKYPFGAAGLLEVAIGLSALLIVPLFGELPELVMKISEVKAVSFENILFLEVLYVFGLLIIPTMCMGALMPLICRIYNERSAFAGRSVGNVYASNTVGTIIGAFVAGFILIPGKFIGMQNTIIFTSALCRVIGSVLILYEVKWHKFFKYIFLCVLWILGIAIDSEIKPWSKSAMVSGPFLGGSQEDYDVIYYREGVDATVAVTSRSSTKGTTLCALRINGKTDASNEWGDMITQSLLANIPLLLKPDAKEICNIGLGSGVTTGSALAHPIEKVDVVEISAAVLEAAKYFEDINKNALKDSRVKIHLADARNFLLLTDYKYDLIISEPSNPWMSGITNLYTREFFAIVRNHLKPGAMFCQWIHSYSMKADDFAAIIRTLSDVFQYVQLWELMSTDFLILGSDKKITIDVESLYYSFSRLPVAEILSSININDPMQMANYYIADGEQMTSWIKNKKILNDDLPYLEFSAPRYLLKNEHDNIIKAISNFNGLPVVIGSHNSILNKEFLEEIKKSRKRRRFLYQAKISASKKNLKNILNNFIQAAISGSSDARTALSLAEELMAYRSVINIKKDQTLIENTFRIISTIIPDFNQFQNVLYGKPARFSWPFAKNKRTEYRPELQRLILEANHLTKTGTKKEAFKKARQALKIAPYDHEVLTLMGSLSLEIEGPEKAIPYLLKALVWSPLDREVNYHLARVYSARGDRDRALHFIKTAIENGFKNFLNLKNDSMFNSLRENERFQQLIDSLTTEVNLQNNLN